MAIGQIFKIHSDFYYIDTGAEILMQSAGGFEKT